MYHKSYIDRSQCSPTGLDACQSFPTHNIQPYEQVFKNLNCTLQSPLTVHYNHTQSDMMILNFEILNWENHVCQILQLQSLNQMVFVDLLISNMHTHQGIHFNYVIDIYTTCSNYLFY